MYMVQKRERIKKRLLDSHLDIFAQEARLAEEEADLERVKEEEEEEEEEKTVIVRKTRSGEVFLISLISCGFGLEGG